MPFADLHAHVIPALDDGPRDFDDTLQLLRAAWESGTRRIVATPHLFHEGFPDVSVAAISAAFGKLQTRLRAEAASPSGEFVTEIQVDLGAEHYLSPELRLALKGRTVLPLNGSRYLLVEGPLTLSGLNWKESLSRITSAGYFPVIAHAERYWPFQRDPGQLAEFIEMGCLVQLNAGSVTGQATGATSRTAVRLLRRGLVHVIASDAHHVRYRPPQLADAAAALAGGPEGDAALRLLDTHPRAILDDRDPPAPVQARKGLWSRLRG